MQNKSVRSFWARKPIRILMVSVPLLAAIAFLASFVTDKRAIQKRYDTAIVERGTIKSRISANGGVQPASRVLIRAPLAGRVEEIPVKAGQHVKAGQLLMTMSTVERANLIDAATTRGPKELAYWDKRVTVNPIQAQIDGIVIQRWLEPGQTFAELDTLFVIADRYVVEALIDETDVAAVRLEQPARIIVDAFREQPLKGHVGSISYDATVKDGVTMFKMKVEFDELPDTVRVGMTANVSFDLDAKTDVLVAPSAALQSRGRELFVLVVPASGGSPQERIVRIGSSDDTRIEIVSGLEAGEQVLVPKRDPTH